MDRETAERLLAGRVAPDDAPPGYCLVARLVGVLRAAGPPETASTRSAEGAAAPSNPATVRARLPRGRVAVLAGILGSTALFGLAGAGALPAPAQRLAAAVLGGVGVHVPNASEPTGVQDENGAVTDPGSDTGGAATRGSDHATTPGTTSPPSLPTSPGSVGTAGAAGHLSTIAPGSDAPASPTAHGDVPASEVDGTSPSGGSTPDGGNLGGGNGGNLVGSGNKAAPDTGNSADGNGPGNAGNHGTGTGKVGRTTGPQPDAGTPAPAHGGATA